MNISLLGTTCRIHVYIIVPEGFWDNAFYDLNPVEIGLERQVEIGNNWRELVHKSPGCLDQ